MPSSPSQSPVRGKKSVSQSKEKKRSNKGSRSGSSGSSSSRRSKSQKKRSRSPRRQNRNYDRRQPEKASPNTKLFITNIDSKIAQAELQRELRDMFEAYGKIKGDIVIKTKQGSSNSYCFIQFEELQMATKAQDALKGKQFRGKQLKVEFGRGERKNQDRKSDKCYICHKQGHFAKECKYNNRQTSGYYDDRRGDRRDDRGRDYRDRQRNYRDYPRKKRSYSESSSRSRHRSDYRHRDRRSPDRKGGHHPSSRRH